MSREFPGPYRLHLENNASSNTGRKIGGFNKKGTTHWYASHRSKTGYVCMDLYGMWFSDMNIGTELVPVVIQALTQV